MASLTMRGNVGAGHTANAIMEGVLASGISCELVDSVNRQIGGTLMHIMVFEKYYMRASNRASLTVVVTGDVFSCVVDAISSGGGQGVIFKLSYGAEHDFVSVVEKILYPNGFEKI